MRLFAKKKLVQRTDRLIAFYSLTPKGLGRTKMETSEPLSYDEALVLGGLQGEDGLTLGQICDLYGHIASPQAIIDSLINAGLIEKHLIPI